LLRARWPEAVDLLQEIVRDCRRQIERIARGGADEGRAVDALTQRYAALFPFASPSGASADEAQTATTGTSNSAEYYVPTIDAEVLSYFVPEIQEYLETVKGAVAHLRSHPGDNDQILTLFRTVHTLKGSAYTVGFIVIGDLAHPLEDCLVDRSRRRASGDSCVVECRGPYDGDRPFAFASRLERCGRLSTGHPCREGFSAPNSAG